MNHLLLKKELNSLADNSRAEILHRFFKTGKGDYGEGDVFLGLTVPQSRKLAIKYQEIPLKGIRFLLDSSIHEERLIALLILVNNYKNNPAKRKEIFDFYMDNKKYVNNWDLVDLSAPKIAGHFLYHMGKEYPAYKILLTNLAKSENLWERRIAIISTYYFISQNKFEETLKISELLLKDPHDLIHKAVGWMLREVGKRDIKILKEFLKENYKSMPRTMLRYSIEKFPEAERKRYLKGEI